VTSRLVPSLRFAAFDLDGTLVDAEARFFDGTLDGVAGLRARGVLAFIVSGRSVESFRRLRIALDVVRIFDSAVLLSDGDVCLNSADLTVDHARTLPADVAGHLLAAGIEDLVAEGPDGFRASSRTAALAYALAYRLPRNVIAVDTTLGLAVGHSTAIVAFGEQVALSGALSGLPVRLQPTYGRGAVVIRPAGSCKASALVRLLHRRFGEVDLSRVVAFGDGANDACLLGAAALGVAVPGGDELAVTHADLTLTGSLGDFLADFDPTAWPERSRRNPAGSHSPSCAVGSGPEGVHPAMR
jgi:hydroxymethylpyrimidine pyrophosphatase-like HAD family hydrolase